MFRSLTDLKKNIFKFFFSFFKKIGKFIFVQCMSNVMHGQELPTPTLYNYCLAHEIWLLRDAKYTHTNMHVTSENSDRVLLKYFSPSYSVIQA